MSAVHRKGAGLPDFSWGNIPKRENMNLKNTKWPQNIFK
jgi:hypothetical protein